jgi:hypothetical protein
MDDSKDAPRFIPKNPLRVGVTSAPTSLSRERIQAKQLRFASAATLRDLNQEYAFYTPALIYMNIRLGGREPFVDFVQDYGKEVVPVTLRFNKPLFSGLLVGGEGSWNYVLYGMEREHWEAYLQWMGPMTFLDRSTQLLARVRFRELEIADPLFFERCTILPPVCPTVPITVFCLDSNRGRCWIEEGQHPLLDLPQYRYSTEVYGDTKAFAQAVLQDQGNPYAAADAVTAHEQLPLQAAAPAKEVKFEELSADKQRELLAAIRQYREQKGRS